MARKGGGTILFVSDGSLASYLGIEPGDRIISVNGRELRDELDFRFLTADEEFSFEVCKKDGKVEAYEVDKDPGEPVGVTFAQPIFDGIKVCQNNCKFCFVRQIPKEMRKTLHLRDDDYRMSFLYGNFISLTNLTGEDWQRIEEQRLSPLRVSVHTTDPSLRQELMGNRRAANVMEHLGRLVQLGIRVHVQIVLLRGINDGDNLGRTLSDLLSLGENLVSVGIVPAVYTRYRTAPPSVGIDPSWAGESLDLIEHYAHGVVEQRGEPWVHAADEFYLVAGRAFPPYEYYGEFHQYENGIGIVPEFRHRLPEAKGMLYGLRKTRPSALRQAHGCYTSPALPTGEREAVSRDGVDDGKFPVVNRAIAVTGLLASGEVQSAVDYLGLSDRISVCPVKNVFYGETVTVSGLMTGQDIASSALSYMRRNPGKYDALLVPSVAVFEERFLDNMYLSVLSEVTGLTAISVEPSPQALAGVFTTVGK